MQFVLTGFTQESGYRVYGFEGTRQDKSKTTHTIRTDLALIRRYGIRVQELPLLCRAMLDVTTEDEAQRAWTFGEAEMSLHEQESAAARLAAKKRFVRRPPQAVQRAQ